MDYLLFIYIFMPQRAISKSLGSLEEKFVYYSNVSYGIYDSLLVEAGDRETNRQMDNGREKRWIDIPCGWNAVLSSKKIT